MQETRVQSLVPEDPMLQGNDVHVPQHWACCLEPRTQLPKSACSEPVPRNRAPAVRSPSTTSTPPSTREAQAATNTPYSQNKQVKINIKLKKRMSKVLMRLQPCGVGRQAGARVTALCLFLHPLALEVQWVHLRVLEPQVSSACLHFTL